MLHVMLNNEFNTFLRRTFCFRSTKEFQHREFARLLEAAFVIRINGDKHFNNEMKSVKICKINIKFDI